MIAGRNHDFEKPKLRRALTGPMMDDSRSAAPRSHSHSHHGSKRSSTHRRHSGSSRRTESSTIYPASEHRHSRDLNPQASSNVPTPKPGHLMRSHSAREEDFDMQPPRPLAVRSMTSPVLPSPHIDMDLAYGPIPPPLPVVRKGAEEVEVRSLVQKVQRLLEEADCLQYSATAIITSLQKNPDAMAAVALTLAEISNIATKLAPNILTALRSSSPAVFALLASPQFLIAGGVAVGVTIVAFGGFKVIKKIRAKNAMEVPGMDEMVEIGGDVNRIDNWRRGIAEVEEQSLGTSVDGEFITPRAAALSMHQAPVRRASEPIGSSTLTESKSTSNSVSGSQKSSSSKSKTSSKADAKSSSKGRKEKKTKKPSPLRLMFS